MSNTDFETQIETISPENITFAFLSALPTAQLKRKALAKLSAAVLHSEEPDIDFAALYQHACECVRTSHQASISYIQRNLCIGYNRAAEIIERMESDGLISAPDETGHRRVL